jgi:4-amino-4-deoxy-L-arabinose transferase-like glycosyltransferase
LDTNAPIRSRAAEEGDIQIPLWSVPLALAVLYVCLFSGLGAIGLVGPDEPRYAAIARAMAETHDWVTPRLWGTPWFEKPVLYYWAAGTAMRLFGVSEFSARLPSALAALLAVLAASWAALRSYGLGAAWYTLLMLPTSVAMIGFARAAGPDMLFAGFLTAAMAVAVEMLQKTRPGTLSRVLFGFFLGAAVLAKGPAAIVLAGGATLLWAALSRQWRAAFQFLHPVVIAAFLATALPWYILCARRNPDFLHAFIWQHNFQRYLTPVFEHRQPFWFFGPILLLAIVPWLLLSLKTTTDVMRSARSGPSGKSPGAFFACWTAFTILFFSLSQSKLPGYILPAIPPIFVPLSSSVAKMVEGATKIGLRLAGWTGAFFLPFVIPLVGVGIGVFPYPQYTLTYAVAFVGGALTVGLAFTKRARAAFLVIVVLITSIVLIANLTVLPRMDAQISARPLAEQLLQANPEGGDIAIYDIPRPWHFGLNFYLGRELPQWAAGSGKPKWIIGSIWTDQQLGSRYKLQLDELCEDNLFRVCSFRRK